MWSKAGRLKGNPPFQELSRPVANRAWIAGGEEFRLGPRPQKLRSAAQVVLQAGGDPASVASFGVLDRSEDSGVSWQRVVPGLNRPRQILDALVVSPRGPLFVGFWDVNARDGGVAKSVDGGETFRVVLDHESVRALAMAPSDPGFIVAGSLGGVFASWDHGESWRRITPPDHPELRNVESVAIDPRDPRVIYVGTRHLPWKTTDGGITWNAVPRGMIDDSDVFTITLDRRNPDWVHATACSGIYRSEGAA